MRKQLIVSVVLTVGFLPSAVRAAGPGQAGGMGKYRLTGFSTIPATQDERADMWTSDAWDKIRQIMAHEVDTGPAIEAAFRNFDGAGLKLAGTQVKPDFSTRVLVLHDRRDLYVYVEAALSKNVTKDRGELDIRNADRANSIEVMVDANHDHLFTWYFTVNLQGERTGTRFFSHVSEDRFAFYATEKNRWGTPWADIAEKDWSVEQERKGDRWRVRFTLPFKLLLQNQTPQVKKPPKDKEAWARKAFDYDKDFGGRMMGINVIRNHHYKPMHTEVSELSPRFGIPVSPWFFD